VGAMKAYYQSLYGPMIDVLRDEFGVEFSLWDTGGGCTALIGEFEGGIRVVVTDSPSSVNGWEAQISDALFRATVGEDSVGYAIGVEAQDMDVLAYDEFPTATVAELPNIVTQVLDLARMKGVL
jgi:hypothetical protein